ncbi:hypothetical protein EDD36DRAFT_420526 [Exophiala viscosa]|uniref:EF-hand domain-containing protein n=1 Tax=Exophiala viscosa TaxID=2486360 RepID=A0AAN6DSU6_9EURO|nr:hypothetical protein EDD36DRAFT_420526 [Exophiala viscosa]
MAAWSRIMQGSALTCAPFKFCDSDLVYYTANTTRSIGEFPHSNSIRRWVLRVVMSGGIKGQGNNLAKGGSASANATCSPTASTEDCVLAKFDILDIDDDWKVSILERLAGWALVWIVSDESDTSTDPADYIYLVKKFEKFDTNGDGYLTLEECAQQLS